jgi:hypothetical protein
VSPPEFADILLTEPRNRVLELLPGDIVVKVREWEKTTATRVYIMAMWAEPDGAPMGFE